VTSKTASVWSTSTARLVGDGSTWTIEAVSPAAIEFAEENIKVEFWQGEPYLFSADWRPACDHVERLADEGWTVEFFTPRGRPQAHRMPTVLGNGG
jgi:hypothetical protein